VTMPTAPRKPDTNPRASAKDRSGRLPRRAAPRVILPVVGCVLVLYLCSYAPMYEWQMQRQNTAYPSGAWRHFYRPAEWLIDHTFMRQPLLSWANLFGVRRSLVTESYFRRMGFWEK